MKSDRDISSVPFSGNGSGEHKRELDVLDRFARRMTILSKRKENLRFEYPSNKDRKKHEMALRFLMGLGAFDIDQDLSQRDLQNFLGKWGWKVPSPEILKGEIDALVKEDFMVDTKALYTLKKTEKLLEESGLIGPGGKNA